MLVSEEDPLIEIVGEMGPFHFFLCTITGLSVVVHAWQMLMNKWLTFPVPFYCEVNDGKRTGIRINKVFIFKLQILWVVRNLIAIHYSMCCQFNFKLN